MPDMKFWDTRRDREILYYTTISEAIEAWADEQTTPLAHPLPETVTVYGFAPMELPPVGRIANSLLNSIFDLYDQDFGNQYDGTATEVSDTLKAAALAFATVFRAEYPVWSCEEIAEMIVRVSDHLPAEAAVDSSVPLSERTRHDE